ncbi:GNAT family protein [Sphingobium sp. HBC34]|uniref:GNAT family protein n=1 Tax=Sphingobium cyanobacteriorum TaxID=3063954 RepID=A0ABT8ZNZ7_9SPHN|nr:GNAT family protein [Sphingobium sp. HBC34]MDO7836264.1 GNAT family protein [Sphingobium sp. HBC34]
MDPLYTNRLIIRGFRETDADDLFAYLHRPGASCFLSMKLDDLQAARAEAIKRVNAEDIFAIEHRQSGRLIGEVFGHFELPDSFSIAWQINTEFCRQGLAFEAARAVIDHLFEVRGVRRIYAYVESDNLPSQRLCSRLGMRQEGVFREFISFETDEAGIPIYVDSLQFAILKKEWIGLPH